MTVLQSTHTRAKVLTGGPGLVRGYTKFLPTKLAPTRAWVGHLHFDSLSDSTTLQFSSKLRESNWVAKQLQSRFQLSRWAHVIVFVECWISTKVEPQLDNDCLKPRPRPCALCRCSWQHPPQHTLSTWLIPPHICLNPVNTHLPPLPTAFASSNGFDDLDTAPRLPQSPRLQSIAPVLSPSLQLLWMLAVGAPSLLDLSATSSLRPPPPALMWPWATHCAVTQCLFRCVESTTYH